MTGASVYFIADALDGENCVLESRWECGGQPLTDPPGRNSRTLIQSPKHGSWLNMAEIELSILQRQCLDRRLGDRATVAQEVAAWVAQRNRTSSAIDWRFTTAEARIKLKRLYPAFEM